MKNIKRIVVIIACFSVKQQLLGQPVLTFFMRPYVIAPTESNSEKIGYKVAKPGHIARKNAKIDNFSIVQGIFSTYGGFLAMSNYIGQTSFPLKHSLPIIYVIITSKISPVMMAGNTINHWELEPGNPAKMYKIERHHVEREDIYYWQVEEVPVPQDNIIPPESVTIIARPKHIIIPEGITITDNNINFILPDILVTKQNEHTANALYLLNIKHFFGHLHPLQKRDVTRYLTHIEE